MLLAEISNIIDSFKNKKILIIGDVMIDHYLWGAVERISPEAPVPVVDTYKEEYRLGGAANVALNIKALGATPYLIGVTGNDRHYKTFCSLLKKEGIDNNLLVKDESRATTIKTRVLAHGQHVLRIDHESKNEIATSISGQVFGLFKKVINDIDGVILQDYNKGVLTSDLINNIINTANEKKMFIAVDPKFKNFFAYKNCTLFKPNLAELQKNTGLPIENDKDMDSTASQVLESINPKHLIVTRGEKGLTVYQKGKSRIDIPTFVQEIYDVSGAGDTVISTITLCLCSGLKVEEAAVIANHAAGSVCRKIGIQPAYPQDIIKSLTNHQNNDAINDK